MLIDAIFWWAAALSCGITSFEVVLR